MTEFTRSLAACQIAVLAWSIAKYFNVPIWNEGWSLDAIGDRSDITLAVFILALIYLPKKARGDMEVTDD